MRKMPGRTLSVPAMGWVLAASLLLSGSQDRETGASPAAPESMWRNFVAGGSSRGRWSGEEDATVRPAPGGTEHVGGSRWRVRELSRTGRGCCILVSCLRGGADEQEGALPGSGPPARAPHFAGDDFGCSSYVLARATRLWQQGGHVPGFCREGGCLRCHPTLEVTQGQILSQSPTDATSSR